MGSNKAMYYAISIILLFTSVLVTTLALYVDSNGNIIAAQTLMMLSNIVSIWSMIALLAGK